jgi:hypothetical protein
MAVALIEGRKRHDDLRKNAFRFEPIVNAPEH